MRFVLVVPPTGSIPTERRLILKDEGVEIGGAVDCDAIIDHPSVGASRVRIERRQNHWLVIDRDGRGLCFVGGIPLRPRQPRIIGPGNKLRLGDVNMELTVEMDFDAGRTTRVIALDAVNAAMEISGNCPRMRIAEGPGLGETFELSYQRECTIGRAATCHCVLGEQAASRVHAAVEWQGETVTVSDRGSTHGTYLGETRLVPHHGVLWDPSEMVRIVGTVLALEMPSKALLGQVLSTIENVGVTAKAKKESARARKRKRSRVTAPREPVPSPQPPAPGPVAPSAEPPPPPPPLLSHQQPVVMPPQVPPPAAGASSPIAALPSPDNVPKPRPSGRLLRILVVLAVVGFVLMTAVLAYWVLWPIVMSALHDR